MERVWGRALQRHRTKFLPNFRTPWKKKEGSSVFPICFCSCLKLVGKIDVFFRISTAHSVAGSRRSSQTHCGWWAHCSSLVWMNQMRKYFVFLSKKRNLLRLLCGANAFMTAYLASVLHILWFALMQRESDTWQSNVPRKVFSSCLYSKWLFYWHN